MFKASSLLSRRAAIGATGVVMAPATPTTPAAGASSSAAPAAASSSSPAAAPTVGHERIANIFANRRNPTNLFQPGMHSGTLSDHPITLKVAKDELDYRQRKLIERGEYEKAAEAEMESEAQGFTSRDGFKETNEYRWALFFVAAGYFAAHLTVYNYFYPDDMRLPYDPQRGYIDSIEKQKMALETLDEMVGGSVLEDVFDSKKALLKDKATKHWEALSGVKEAAATA